MADVARTAVYPGTFDPITNGHLDVLDRALRVFDRVEVAVGVNASKDALLSVEQRVALIEECTAGIEGVTVASFRGLVVDHARSRGATALIRGIRQTGDLEYEMRMHFANRRLHPDLETVFFVPSEEHALVSASIVREIHRWGGDVDSFVPEPVARMLRMLTNSR